MNIMKMLGHSIVATAGTLALTPIYLAEKTCKLGEVSSRTVKKAAAWSEETCLKGAAGCLSADEYVRNLCAEKRLLIDIKTAKSCGDIMALVPEGADVSDELLEVLQQHVEKLSKPAPATVLPMAPASAGPALV